MHLRQYRKAASGKAGGTGHRCYRLSSGEGVVGRNMVTGAPYLHSGLYPNTCPPQLV